MDLIRPLKKHEVQKKHREVEPSDSGVPASNEDALTEDWSSQYSQVQVGTWQQGSSLSDINNLVTGLRFYSKVHTGSHSKMVHLSGTAETC